MLIPLRFIILIFGVVEICVGGTKKPGLVTKNKDGNKNGILGNIMARLPTNVDMTRYKQKVLSIESS